MKKESIICYLIFLICILFGSCNDDLLSNQSEDDIDQKSIPQIAEYVTVKDLKWVLTISEEEASKLGFSQKDYEESTKEIADMNKSLEKLKKDTNTIVHLILPTEQIIIAKGEVEHISNIKTKAGHCSFENFITSIDVPENYVKYTSFVTAAENYRVCIEGKVNTHPYSHLLSWELSILDDIWKVNRVVMGTYMNTEFNLEWSMGGVGFPVTLLDWKFFLNYTTPPTGYSTWMTVSFYILRY